MSPPCRVLSVRVKFSLLIRSSFPIDQGLFRCWVVPFVVIQNFEILLKETEVQGTGRVSPHTKTGSSEVRRDGGTKTTRGKWTFESVRPQSTDMERARVKRVTI